MLSTPFEFQIVLTPKPVHHTDSTTLVLSLQKFPRTTVGRDYLTNFAVALVVLQQRPSFQEIALQRPKFVIYVPSSMTRNLGAFVGPTSQGDLRFVEQPFVFRTYNLD